MTWAACCGRFLARDAIKKITYNHLWKYCSAELQNLNVYRSLHSDRNETDKPDVRL